MYLLHSHVFVITGHGSNDTAIQIKETLTSAALVTHQRKSLLSTTCDSCLGQSMCPTFYTLFNSILAFRELRLFFVSIEALISTAIYVVHASTAVTLCALLCLR